MSGPWKEYLQGAGWGLVLFLFLVAVLLFAGDFSASKFIYVDF